MGSKKDRRARKKANKEIGKAGISLTAYERSIIRKVKAGLPLGEHGAQTLLKLQVLEVRRMTDGLEKTVKTYLHNYNNMNKQFNCYQFQCITQDLQSIIDHCESLRVDGPKEAMKDIPLEDSEMDVPMSSEGFEPTVIEGEKQ